MNASALTIEHRAGGPEDSEGWDDVARSAGNIVQATLFDRVQAFFAMEPVYFLARYEGHIAGGVKIYASASRSLPKLSRKFTLGYLQFGEILHAIPESSGVLAPALRRAVARYLEEKGAVSFRVSGLYGGEDGLLGLDAPAASEFVFNVASIDLRRPEDELWSAVHKSHRADVRRAGREHLGFEVGGDVARLAGLLDETYRGQASAGPDRGYVAHVPHALGKHAELFYVTQAGVDLAGALCLTFGPVAYWLFGGTARQGMGAGPLLQWRLIQHLKGRGFARYVLGQVAAADDPANPKFAQGITRFKRHLGPEEIGSATRTYVLKPWRHAAWRVAAAAAARVRKHSTWTTRG